MNKEEEEAGSILISLANQRNHPIRRNKSMSIQNLLENKEKSFYKQDRQWMVNKFLFNSLFIHFRNNMIQLNVLYYLRINQIIHLLHPLLLLLIYSKQMNSICQWMRWWMVVCNHLIIQCIKSQKDLTHNFLEWKRGKWMISYCLLLTFIYRKHQESLVSTASMSINIFIKLILI